MASYYGENWFNQAKMYVDGALVVTATDNTDYTTLKKLLSLKMLVIVMF